MLPLSFSTITQHAILEALQKGRVVFFLGAGINLADRPISSSFKWSPGAGFPNARELAEFLVAQSGFGVDVDSSDLIKVSQFFETTRGRTYVTDLIESIFTKDGPTNSPHDFLSNYCHYAVNKSYKPIFITTNYDHTLEESFKCVGIDFDLYILEMESYSSHPIKLYKNNVHAKDSYEIHYDKPSIIKIHGHARYKKDDPSCYVISEDDYIRFLATVDPFKIFPPELCAKLRQSHYLFMGYSLRDWNMRVFLYRLWGGEIPNYQSWSVQYQISEFEYQLWVKKNIETIESNLADFCNILGSQLWGGA